MTTHLNADHSVFEAEGVKVFYNGFLALLDVHIKIPARKIVAFIGPSGCGKSTLLRCFNRMNDLIPGAKVEGKLAAESSRYLAKIALDAPVSLEEDKEE